MASPRFGLVNSRIGGEVSVVNDTNGTNVAERVTLAASPLRRMRGLLGRPPLTAGEGLLIEPCQAVHTLGMAYPIDVVHLDRNDIVVRVLHELPPRRLGPIVWRSHRVLELPPGKAAGISEGDRLTVKKQERNSQLDARHRARW
jgi:uncharacterized membrane protein (UPF0127 family)